jgi:hypothetical protein
MPDHCVDRATTVALLNRSHDLPVSADANEIALLVRQRVKGQQALALV